LKAPPTLSALYARALQERGFHEDPMQLEAVARLEDLRGRLIAAHAGSRRFATRLAKRVLKSGAARGPDGLYLWGPVGRGKTWLMDLFFQSLPFEGRRRHHFHRLMHEVHARLGKLRSRAEPLDMIGAQMAKDTCVLCLDELYVEDIADAMILGGFLRALIGRGVTLVATSNTPPHRLYERGLQRERFLPAIALIEQHAEVLAMRGGVDYRLRQLTEAGVYLASEDPASNAKLEALFAELADGEGKRGGSIEIDGRHIPVVRRDEAVVWFEFDALCGSARSQNDYIEIARDYHCVLVSNVPVLDGSRDDPARRFIALVDELYDRNVSLVISAGAEPPALYRGDRLRSAFARTASRLMEMRSAEYLGREHKG
jgi:cell division protein ZapE